MNSNGWKILVFSVLLCWIGMPQGLADVVVPISVSQQVSVSGTAYACDGGCEMFTGIQDNGSSFSSGNANMLLPPVPSLSQDGNASDSIPLNSFFSRTASADASASQTFTSTPSSLNLGLSVSSDFGGNDSLMDGSVNADSKYTLVFDLYNPFVVELSGDISGGTPSNNGGELDGSFDGEIHLTGPGTEFDQVLSFPYSSSSQGQSFDQSLALGPGQYTLDAVAMLNGQQNYFLDSSSFLDVSLNADFTPAIPEPARVSTVLGVLMMIGIFFARRHGQSRLSV